MMEKWIEEFPQQLLEALDIGANARLKIPEIYTTSIVVTGMGGSGIGGNLVVELANGDLKVPMLVSKDYFIPSFTNPGTLVIVSSYSGNTEETISAMQLAERKGAHIVCITTGGEVQDFAHEKGFDVIQIPEGMPPRTCLGYSFVQQLCVLSHFKLINGKVLVNVKSAAILLIDDQVGIMAEAKKLADSLFKKLPVIYTTLGMESAGVRFRQQLNENAKMLCWHHVIPEMNHNELVGWHDQNPNLAVVFLRHENEFPRTSQRISLSKHIIEKYTPHIFEVWGKGISRTEKALYLIHLADWTSLFLAYLRKVDPVEVNVIDYLKTELGKFD